MGLAPEPPAAVGVRAVSASCARAAGCQIVPRSFNSTRMWKAGRPARYVFGLWTGITLVCAASALTGYAAFQRFSPDVVAGTTAVAAGAILAMLADTTIPVAFE